MLLLDMSEFERKAREIGGASDQMAFALSQSLNAAAFAARQRIIAETWPSAIEVRNKSFLRAALRVEPASKATMRVAVVDTLKRASLKAHADGGTKTGRGMLAIPSKSVRRTAKGVVASQRPRNLKRAVVKKGLIFQVEGKGKTARLRLMYRLTRQAKIKADVPFYRDWRRFMLDEVRRTFPVAMAKAMASRR